MYSFSTHILIILLNFKYFFEGRKPITVKIWIKASSGCPVMYHYAIRIFFQDVNKGMIHFRVSVLHVKMNAIDSGEEIAKKSSASLFGRQKKINKTYYLGYIIKDK